MDTNILNLKISENLKQINTVQGENYDYNIRVGTNDLEKDCYILDIKDLDENKIVGSFCTKEKFNTVTKNIDSFIGGVYVQGVNINRNKIKYIKNIYLINKIEQLTKAVKSNKKNKIKKINNDMINKYQEISILNSEIQDYKGLIENLYAIKNISK